MPASSEYKFYEWTLEVKQVCVGEATQETSGVETTENVPLFVSLIIASMVSKTNEYEKAES